MSTYWRVVILAAVRTSVAFVALAVAATTVMQLQNGFDGSALLRGIGYALAVAAITSLFGGLGTLTLWRRPAIPRRYVVLPAGVATFLGWIGLGLTTTFVSGTTTWLVGYIPAGLLTAVTTMLSTDSALRKVDADQKTSELDA
ncbi:hypothetical protein GCM10009860_01550 [Microbacterium mitrae]|uniref:Uncharacterized protein n=1 Tax=Microbacterium mitrae TaxID=664640 RepID=A0A5C8HNM2_9MICO|nr:hypothetical protein [Microbacterium mitrae]TXK05575.1 hypothetical protein FVP60_00820 [Microbacterium mitrae]